MNPSQSFNNAMSYNNAMRWIFRVGLEVETLIPIITDQFSKLKADWFTRIEACKSERLFDEQNRVLTQYQLYFELKKGNKKPTILYCYFSLYSPDEEHIEHYLPTVWIGHAIEDWVAVLECNYKKNLMDEYRLACDGRLFIEDNYDASNVLIKNWEYYVPLFSLDSIDAIHKEIINPVKALLAREPDGDTFASDTSALRFSVRDGQYEWEPTTTPSSSTPTNC